VLHRDEAVAVLERRLGVVDGAWPNDDEQPALGVFALDDGDGLIAPGEDGFA
jgi:hypothetical protein